MSADPLDSTPVNPALSSSLMGARLGAGIGSTVGLAVGSAGGIRRYLKNNGGNPPSLGGAVMGGLGGSVVGGLTGAGLGGLGGLAVYLLAKKLDGGGVPDFPDTSNQVNAGGAVKSAELRAMLGLTTRRILR